MLSSEGCVTLANGQSGRSQLLGNTLGTLTLACRWEGDPSNTSLHRGSAPTSEVLRTWGSSGVLGMRPWCSLSS